MKTKIQAGAEAPPQPPSPQTNAANVVATPAPSKPANAPNNIAPAGQTLTTNDLLNLRLAKMQQLVSAQNVPVQFFGMVMDQDSNALAGVRVTLMTRHNEYVIPNSPEAARVATLSPDEMQKFLSPTIVVTSDSNGRFQWSDASVTGDMVGVKSMEKDGYEAEPGQYSCGAGSGIYDNPVIFKMWSTNIHEQLITGNKSFEVIPDGKSYFINLVDGTISQQEGGDLKVWIQYTNQPMRGQVYDWSAGIEVMNGGLWEVPQAAMNSGFLPDPPFAMYSAPTDGYIPSFTLKSKIKGGQNGEIGNRFFYLSLKNGQEYGRMSIDLFAPYGHLHPGLICLSYAINPSGSRILR